MKLILMLSKFTMQCYHDGGFSSMMDSSSLNCKVSLNGAELWRKFHENDTEMIITNNGRRMFPTINIKVDDLVPETMYCMFIYFEQIGNCREKYSTTTGWSPAGSSDAQNPNRTYIHPRSPAKGSEWMANGVSFNKLKLTNKIPSINQPLELGHVVLSSMHRYQPKIIIIESDKLIQQQQQQQQMYHIHDSNNFKYPTKTIVFPELCFVAVTAYQNQQITKLKVENNPFAKGFKENGKSYAKRKQRQEQQQEKESKIIKIDDNSPPSSPEIQVDDDLPTSTTNRQTSPPSTLQYLPIYSYNYQSYHPIYSPQAYWYQPYYYHHHHLPYPQYHGNLNGIQSMNVATPQDLVVRSLKNYASAPLDNQQTPKVKPLSEFTIDAILRK